jgi:hypothetical protein
MEVTESAGARILNSLSAKNRFPSAGRVTVGIAVALLVAGCGQQSAGTGGDESAALDARERELALREAEVNLKEREEALARREAALGVKPDPADAAKATAPPPSAKIPPAPKPAAAAKPKPAVKETAKDTAVASLPPPPPPPPPITVPSRTQITVALDQDLSSKTAIAGDPFEARVASSILVDGRVAVPAGTRVTGSVTEVISGSRKIGAIPTLGLSFDSLVLPDGQRVAISGELVERGASERGRDTAKILGGAAAGAVLGHQVKKGDSGKVLGGLLGGAIGAVAAQKTGTEVQLVTGSELTISLAAPFEVKGR